MNISLKKIAAAACMAAFLATSFLPEAGDAANGRMSLAQAQQQVKYPHYKKLVRNQKKTTQKVSQAQRRNIRSWADKHNRPAPYTKGPVDRTWVPNRHAPSHNMKAGGKNFKKKAPAYKANRPVRQMPSKIYNRPDVKRKSNMKPAPSNWSGIRR